MLVPIVALLAIAAGAIGLVTLSKASHVSSLEHRVAALDQRLAAAQQTVATLKSSVGDTASSTTVAHLRGSLSVMRRNLSFVHDTTVPLLPQLRALWICVPQLQRELEGLQLRIRAKVATITDPVRVSKGCSATLLP